MMWARVAVLVAILGLAIGATGPKLLKAARIQGWIGGAFASEVVLTQKGRDAATRADREDVYWVSWSEGDASGSPLDRTRVGPGDWDRMRVGDRVRAYSVPGDPREYLQEDVFFAPGNIVIDVVILAAELAGAAVMAWLVFRPARPKREAPPFVLPPPP